MCEIAEKDRLQKKLSLLDVFVLATGTTLSAGFFLLPGLAAEKAGASIILAYILAAIPLIPVLLYTRQGPRPGLRNYWRNRYMARHDFKSVFCPYRNGFLHFYIYSRPADRTNRLITCNSDRYS